jgi:metallo-beta-lactamase family protein
MKADTSPARVSFLGAARSVTGSRYLVEAGDSRVMVDCGLHQERDQNAKNWEPFSFPADRLDAVVLTHAHLDHCGLLPRLVRDGYEGRIFCTPPTAEIARIVMLDSARLQVEDVENKKKRHDQQKKISPHPLVPLYTEKDAENAASLFMAVSLREQTEIAPGIAAEYFEAGHILGSASIRLRIKTGSGERTVLFSGDIGRWNKPILKDPDPFTPSDYIVMESTYGDRTHDKEDRIRSDLGDIIKRTVKAGGNIVIPSFAIERSQEILYYLNNLLMADEIPSLMVFLDSPMATKVTEVFGHHPEYLDSETLGLIRSKKSPFEFRSLVISRRTEDSKAINQIKGSVIIIAGAGMCTGGRIKHHLIHNISRPESTILFVGYQAAGTLGREILNGASTVRILGETMRVKARIERIEGFSAHADRDELIRWTGSQAAAPRRVFVTHGEPETAESFAGFLAEKRGWKVSVPSAGETASLE